MREACLICTIGVLSGCQVLAGLTERSRGESLDESTTVDGQPNPMIGGMDGSGGTDSSGGTAGSEAQSAASGGTTGGRPSATDSSGSGSGGTTAGSSSGGNGASGSGGEPGTTDGNPSATDSSGSGSGGTTGGTSGGGDGASGSGGEPDTTVAASSGGGGGSTGGTGGAPVECTLNSDCDDQDPCTDDVCIDNDCQKNPADEGTKCDDADDNTEGDACDGAGYCVGNQVCAEPEMLLCPDEDRAPLVHGGSFYMGPIDESFATVADFELDKYEVTVSEFRAFVETQRSERIPDAGDGAHSLIAESGWQDAWNVYVDVSQTDLESSLECSPSLSTYASSGNDALPINCVTWYEAFAYCIWAGKRLPTSAEWEYAASGGCQEWKYPWGNDTPDDSRVSYNCQSDGSLPGECAFSDIEPVGSKPGGVGPYCQYDLAGSMWEWVFDNDGIRPSVCDNCAIVSSLYDYRVLRGGSWQYGPEGLQATYALVNYASYRSPDLGFRCARLP